MCFKAGQAAQKLQKVKPQPQSFKVEIKLFLIKIQA